MTTIKLRYENGLLQFEGELGYWINELSWFKLDPRTSIWSAPAESYRDTVLYLLKNRVSVIDEARKYKKLELQLSESIIPREHQHLALKAWQDQDSRGVVSLPTGAGKTILAVLAIEAIKRPTLVVVPTIDLLLQWLRILEKFFGGPVGQLGAGQRELHDLTVATYDSASILADKIGDRFGLVVFDECHHLPAPQYQFIAKALIAPFRLGLSATVERADGKENILFELLGDMCYRGEIGQMVDQVLAPYDVINVQVPLSDHEKKAYQEARTVYTQFIKRAGINFSEPQGWQEFIRKSSILPGGREAMEAYREQKRLAQGAEGKIFELWRILQIHRGERIIVFTQDNATAYDIGRRFVLPVLTHQTKPKERKLLLEAFRDGRIDVLVTSKVLNEGVDVPEASVGIVISGSGAVREHVQRLGRILRHQAGKRAKLYEVISKDTSEYYVNQRRRNHNAYQKPTEIQRSWR